MHALLGLLLRSPVRDSSKHRRRKEGRCGPVSACIRPAELGSPYCRLGGSVRVIGVIDLGVRCCVHGAEGMWIDRSSHKRSTRGPPESEGGNNSCIYEGSNYLSHHRNTDMRARAHWLPITAGKACRV
jgi:hypothetical protein